MAVSTQSNIPIAGIKDGVIILKDGQYRIILEIAAINFDLKSEQEQNSLIFQYQSFLNSLHFPIEIVVQSKKLDLSPYLKKIQDLANKQTNELIKIQTQDYVEFVGQLVNLANIMKKRFYVTVGFQPIVVSNGILDKLFKRSDVGTKLKISEADFESYSKELRQRAQTVAQSLGGMGLHCKQLSTQEIIENFYEIYNPEVAGKERLTDTSEVSGYVTQIKRDDTQANDQIQVSTLTESKDIHDINSETVIDNRNIVVQQQKAVTRQAPVNNIQKTEENDTPLPGENKQSNSSNQKPGQFSQNNQNVQSIQTSQAQAPAFSSPQSQYPKISDTQQAQSDFTNNQNYGQ